MARSIKWLGPFRQRLQSISQEVEVIFVPSNLVAYPGEIWLMSGSRSQHFVWFDYSSRTTHIDDRFRCTAELRFALYLTFK